MPSIPATAERTPPPAASEVLRLEDVTVEFGTSAGTVVAAREVTLSVGEGECLGIVGESGAGKSQLFLAVMGLLAANARTRGSARLGGVELLSQPARVLDRVRGSRIALVPQDPITSLTPHLTVGDQLAEVMRRHLGLPGAAARARALALLTRVHVTDAARRLRQYPHELSGGMRQRVMIAIALACEPRLLIADEPTTSLDVTIQAQILALLAELKRERAMAMVLITHDLGAVAGVADRVAVMRAGSVIESGPVGAVLQSPREPYTRELLRGSEPPAAAAVDTAVPAGAPVLALEDVSVHFARGRLAAVSGVTVSLRAGEALGVVGESGAGKSTLARALLALLRPSSGRIVWMGRSLLELPARELRSLRSELQIIFQDPLGSLDPRMTVAELVGEPLRVHERTLGRAARAAATLAMLERVGLGSALLGRYPHELSGGQCQRVGIARAMIVKPLLLVCDEPVSALDAPTQRQIVELLADLKREARLSLVFVSHNLQLVRRLCERVLVLYLGRMMELAAAQDLYRLPLHPYTQELLAAIPVVDPQLQPARLTRTLTGEPPSPLSPPSGCVYRTRCPHALAVCQERIPPWESGGERREVACHRWRELSLDA